MNTDSIIIRCTNCGAKNRIPKIRLNDRPVCGRCHSRLPENQAFDRPVIVSDKNFNDEIISSPVPVLLDCWAPWCGPCRTVGPIIDNWPKNLQIKLNSASSMLMKIHLPRQSIIS